MSPDEVARILGGTVIRRRERESGITRTVYQAPGWRFLDCERCGKALSAHPYRQPRRATLCEKHMPPPQLHRDVEFSDARSYLMAAYDTYKHESKLKTVDKDRAFDRFIKYLEKNNGR